MRSSAPGSSRASSTGPSCATSGAAWGMSTTVIGRVPEVGDADEPFRTVLVEIWERLGADGYADGTELVADLDALDALLRAHRGERVADGRLADLRARARTFGLHLAKLDLRVHASAIRAPDDRIRGTLAAAASAQATARRRRPSTA